MVQPIPDEARFPIGTRVRIADLKELARFQADWKFHHPLEPEQLEYAGQIALVSEVTYYHGGDPLYSLEDVPGTWHEQCLRAP
jgi:hypothetical protein